MNEEWGNVFKYEKCWKPALPVSTLIISSDRQNDHRQSKQQPCGFGEGHADRDKHCGYVVTWPASMQDGHFTHMNKLLSVPVNVHHRSTMSPPKPCNVSLMLDKSLSVCRCVSPSCTVYVAEHKTMGIITSNLMFSDHVPVVSNESLQ